MNRRLFLKSALATGAAVSAVGAGLLMPSTVFAKGIPSFEKAGADISASIAGAAKGEFKFKAPKIAENGAVVPVEINASKMSGVTQIAIRVQNNATQLAASFALSGAIGFVSTRIKMGKSSPVNAVVVANGKTSVITKDVKVTVGGCGG